MAADPFALFDEWFAEARASEPNDAEAMALATANSKATPSVRMVLLKGHGPDGFVFYTNEQSRKAGELAESRGGGACSSTGSRCGGRCGSKGRHERVPDAQADAYFSTRARDFPTRRMGLGPVAAA